MNKERVKTGQGEGCLDWRRSWAELLFSAQKSMGDDLLEIGRAFHLRAVALDHGSRLDTTQMGKVGKQGLWRARDTGVHLSSMATHRLPVLRAWEGGSARALWGSLVGTS